MLTPQFGFGVMCCKAKAKAKARAKYKVNTKETQMVFKENTYPNLINQTRRCFYSQSYLKKKYSFPSDIPLIDIISNTLCRIYYVSFVLLNFIGNKKPDFIFKSVWPCYSLVKKLLSFTEISTNLMAWQLFSGKLFSKQLTFNLMVFKIYCIIFFFEGLCDFRWLTVWS